jgi:hypothetical protein
LTFLFGLIELDYNLFITLACGGANVGDTFHHNVFPILFPNCLGYKIVKGRINKLLMFLEIGLILLGMLIFGFIREGIDRYKSGGKSAEERYKEDKSDSPFP